MRVQLIDHQVARRGGHHSSRMPSVGSHYETRATETHLFLHANLSARNFNFLLSVSCISRSSYRGLHFFLFKLSYSRYIVLKSSFFSDIRLHEKIPFYRQKKS